MELIILRLLNTRKCDIIDLMEILFRLLVFAASAWVSNKYADGYWVVGPVFGMAVVSYDMKSFRDLNIFKHAFFIAVSTLVYALVYRISRLEWGNGTDLFDYFIGSFPAAIVTGSALMAVAHTVFFNKSKEVMVRAIAAMVVTFYLLVFFMYFNEKSHLGLRFQWIAFMITVWQGTYLYTFFSKSK